MFKIFKKPLTMRRQLRRYVIGITLVVAAAYTILLSHYLDKGVEQVARLTMLMDVRSFEADYKGDPNTSLPVTRTRKMYLDNLDAAPELFRRLLEDEPLEKGEFREVEYFPNWEEDGAFFGRSGMEDARFVLYHHYVLNDGRSLYAIANIEVNLITDEEIREFDQLWIISWVAAVVFIALMITVLWLYNRQVNRYTTELANWAEDLTLEKLPEEHPDFRYDELNRIAEQLREAFARIGRLLEREHLFLRNASHELRTPIAVVRANMELLQRMGYDKKLAGPLERVGRANTTMQQLTETLLWLSRENEAKPRLSRLQPAKLVEELADDLDYLLAGKPVELTKVLDTTEAEFVLPETPLRIVLNNLLRNAYQHTEEGTISLMCKDGFIHVENHDEGLSASNGEDSFGLGLMLVQQICKRMEWELTLEARENGVSAVLKLPAEMD